MDEFAVYLREVLKKLKYEIKDAKVKEEFDGLIDLILKSATLLKKTKHEFALACQMFENLLSKTVLQPKPAKEDSVKVIGILDTRGIRSDYIFFGGLSDGDYPHKQKQEMIIPDRIRKMLNLMHFEKRIEVQRLHYFRLIEQSEKDTFLSYPAQDKDRLILPSNFLPEAEGSSKTAHIDVKDMQFSAEESQIKEGGKGKKELAGFGEIIFKDSVREKTVPYGILKEDGFINVTALDKYIDCPFIYYLEEVLRATPMEEPAYELDSATLGNIMHDVMKDTFKTGIKNLKNLKECIINSLENKLKDQNIGLFWKDFIRQRVNLIAGSVIKEEEKLFERFNEIVFVEKKEKIELVEGKLKVKGRIDRVDAGGKKFIIIDYKTGKSADDYIAKTNKIESLQLGLYAKMIEKEMPGFLPKALCIYNLREGRMRFVKEDKVEFIKEESVKKAVEVVENIKNANFQKNKNKRCWFCRYGGICDKAN